MPDLPAVSGVYQGKLSAKFVIDESGHTSNVTVDTSDLRLGGKSVSQHDVERYAIDSLRGRKFSPRPESCKVTFSAWVN
jgi:hypothetical protein